MCDSGGVALMRDSVALMRDSEGVALVHDNGGCSTDA